MLDLHIVETKSVSDIADTVKCKMHMSDNPNNSEGKQKYIANERM